jgi:hypothetical protein
MLPLSVGGAGPLGQDHWGKTIGARPLGQDHWGKTIGVMPGMQKLRGARAQISPRSEAGPLHTRNPAPHRTCLANVLLNNARRDSRPSHAMNSHILLRIFTFVLLLQTGCVEISIGSRKGAPLPPAPPVVPPLSPPPASYSPADTATLAEIDAAARLSFDASRQQALLQIATRPTLSSPVQVHLVNTAYRGISFDAGRIEILRAVIAREDFDDAVRQAIVSQLHRLSFDASRQTLLNAIHARLTDPPSPMPPTP